MGSEVSSSLTGEILSDLGGAWRARGPGPAAALCMLNAGGILGKHVEYHCSSLSTSEHFREPADNTPLWRWVANINLIDFVQASTIVCLTRLSFYCIELDWRGIRRWGGGRGAVISRVVEGEPSAGSDAVPRGELDPDWTLERVLARHHPPGFPFCGARRRPGEDAFSQAFAPIGSRSGAANKMAETSNR